MMKQNEIFIATFLFFLLLSFNSFSQNKQSKVIIDSKTKLAIDYVYISSDDKKINLLSTKEGKFTFLFDDNSKAFTFYKIGYYPKTITKEVLSKRDTVLLEERYIGLDEITVRSNAIDTIVRDKRYYVNDYLVLPNSDFLILTSKINFKGFEIAYYKKDKGIIFSKKIKNEKDEHFFVDCFKNIHLVTNTFSRQLFFISDTVFEFLDKNIRSKFDSTLAKCVLKIDSQVLVKSSLPPQIIKGQYFDHTKNSPFLTYVKLSKHHRKNFYTIMYNKELREMVDYEIADANMTQSSTTMLGGQAQSGQSSEAKFVQFFSQIAKPIYAPVFLKNDTVIVLNFQENTIVFFNKNGVILKEIKINEKEFSSFHDFEIIYDALKQKFYLREKEFDRQTLAVVDIYKGAVSKKIKLEKTFAKNIQVFNGRIYYLVKEKEWDDTSYLYQQN